MGNGTSARLLTLLALLVSGCGTGSEAPTAALTIIQQPSDITIPLGTSATFHVSAQAGGDALTYQWKRNGRPIADTNSPAYTTALVSLADNGDQYTATISDKNQELQSEAATLTVGPRSPATGDLRFQNVASPLTRSGYRAEETTNLISRGSYVFSDAFGTPLSLGLGACGANYGPNPGCSWLIETFSAPQSVAGSSISYQSGYLDSFSADVSQEISRTSSVITSLDCEANPNTYAWAVMKSTQSAPFRGEVRHIAASALDADVRPLAAQGKVVTALCIANGVTTYTDYDWDADQATAYETQIYGNVTFDQIGAQAKLLAQNGYILTALGGSDIDGYILIGTRVSGDSLPRPMIVVSESGLPNLRESGYAIVALLIDASGTTTWIGEQ